MQEVSKLTSEIKKKDADRTDMSAQAVQRRRRERERLQSLVDQLNQEFKNQTVVYQNTKNRLAKEKESWFDWTIFPTHPVNPPPRNRTVMAILQHCIVPKCLFGPNEAIFSAKFLKEMHRLGTKNFSTLTLYDKVPLPSCVWLTRFSDFCQRARDGYFHLHQPRGGKLREVPARSSPRFNTVVQR